MRSSAPLTSSFFSSLISSNKSDLGNVCQNVWTSAGDNLRIGKEIVIYPGTKPHPLITLTKLGKAKLRRDVFVKFKGKFLVARV